MKGISGVQRLLSARVLLRGFTTSKNAALFVGRSNALLYQRVNVPQTRQAHNNTKEEEHDYDEYDPDFKYEEPRNLSVVLVFSLFFFLIGLGAGLSTAWNYPNANAGDGDEEEGDEEDKLNSNTSRDAFLETFNSFADQEKDGEKYLTFEAFIRSLIMPRPNTPAWVAFPRKDGELVVDKKLFEDPDLKAMFSFADANSDNMISFAEYDLFLTLLSLNPNQFKLAFKMFDIDGNGTIDINEFKQILQANRRKKDRDIDFKNNFVVQQFFGPNETNKVTLEDFVRFINKCKEVLQKLEFMQHDYEGRGQISIESFSELITNTSHFNTVRNIPEFKRQLNLLKTNGFFAPTGRVDFDTYKAFQHMSERINDIALALQLYTAPGRTVGKSDFVRALKNVGIWDVPPKVVDLVFALYDTDKNGELDWKEFATVLKQKNVNDQNIAQKKLN
jgi:Ca2+-binding EF-hand superfamily protein